MIYKKYDISKSLSGNQIIWIARNAAGIVVIRETSLEKLKKEIDRREEEEKKRLLAEQKKETKKKTTKIAKKEEPETVSQISSIPKLTEEKPSISTKSPPKGPNGKFITQKSQEDKETKTSSKKKSFWDKLVG